jgi:hypothetical protein
MWSKREGFPPDEFFAALNPKLADIIEMKMTRKYKFIKAPDQEMKNKNRFRKFINEIIISIFVQRL